ncbi:NADH-quinone oxidoreductase subunit D [Rhodobacteraceae bacterium 2CG4]|uniref:NADH-quinone oxidoreductase subunit D n=2 Tax=Halovulum marinum TaxID=2662447 RepID=A0A6L5YXY2_9RHOB|nr:NADH-quinone oxidoreductase subunit D [Halovulum marinum]
MSMVGLTEGKPVSPDGLVMEWIDAPFGPFFPGLPGGLGLTLTLDGDSVVRAAVSSHASGPPAPDLAAKDLPDRLAALSPLAPGALRELACRALESVSGIAPGPDAATARAAAVERERVASHLNWLADLARQTGLSWLERRAAALHQGLRAAGTDEIARRAPAIRALAGRVRRTPLLRDKLAGIGRIGTSGAEGIVGPVARATGLATDARADDPAYAELGFATLTQTSGDAWARLSQRLAEIGQSLDLIARAGAIALPEAPAPLPRDGHGMASLETPRGKATLHLILKDGSAGTVHLTTPFAALAALVEPMTRQMELAEALTAIASLDLDPWGVDA